jgi:drug/metabolite transporter (DMT)-like permease
VWLLLPPLLWAGNAVVGRLLVAHMAPVGMNALRWLLVALLLAPLAWRVWLKPRDLWRNAPYLALIGGLGVGSYNALQYLALQTSTPINVTLIGASMPLWMMLVGRIGFGQALASHQVLGAGVSLLGVALVLSQGRLQALWQLHLVPGDLLMLLASLAWACYSWLLARPPQGMQGEARPSWDWAAFLWVQVLFGVAWAGGAAGLEAAWVEVGALARGFWPDGWWAWAGMVFIAVGPSIVAYRCWGLGVQAVGPTLASFFVNLTPVFAAVWSLALLGQGPRWYHPVALGLIAAGIAVSSRAQAHAQRRQPDH